MVCGIIPYVQIALTPAIQFSDTCPSRITRVLICPYRKKSIPDGGTPQRRLQYSTYDNRGNPLEYYLDDKKIYVSLVWGYDTTLVIGELHNVTLSDAQTAMSTAGMTMSNMSVPALGATETTKIRNLQASFPYGMISWYAHGLHL